MFKRFRKNEKGQGMVEYGLILALVSIISITSLGGIGGNIKDKFDKVVSVIGGSVVEDVVEDDTYTEEEIQSLIEQEGYIPIATAGELNQLRDDAEQTFGGKEYTSGLDRKYIQVANIDLGGIDNFEPIGTKDTTNSFTGTYDGGGYTISNLKIDRGSNGYAGLFGRIDGSAELKNIGLVNADVSGGIYVGGLVGRQSSGSTITNSYATGKVNGESFVGGLVGYQYNGSITNSYASGKVNGGDYVGGLVGYQHSGSITNSYSTGEVNSTGSRVGGLVGYQRDGGSVTNSYASGSVSGTGGYVGGLVGYQYQYDGSITSSYWDKDTTGQNISSGAGATGKTTVEMKTKETFSGWNFDTIWQIKSGEYPTLQW